MHNLIVDLFGDTESRMERLLESGGPEEMETAAREALRELRRRLGLVEAASEDSAERSFSSN